MYFAGMMIGVMIVGHLSDRFGRKTILVPIVLGTVTFGSLLPFSPNIESFIALRFLQGAFRYWTNF
jgi:MFS family permease